MKSGHWTNERLASRLNMDIDYIRQVTSGNKVPSPELAAAIIETVFPTQSVSAVEVFPLLADKLPVNSIDTASSSGNSMNRLSKGSTARILHRTESTLSRQ